MAHQIVAAVGSKQTSNPKTVLAFYATVLGIVLAGTISAVGVLAWTDTATELIPWVLLVGWSTALAIVAGVYRLNSKDPSRLMLGQITGTEYAAIHSTTLGDSTRGEREAIVGAGVPLQALEGAVVETPDSQDVEDAK
ncbi:hypothetical protein V2J56_08230 [Georgenia sp. MJ206]|uniref:hypothetical protein n=1 Tax=Georgenia wangjunii TaxID=3117730 RepID=UPI002F26A684